MPRLSDLRIVTKVTIPLLLVTAVAGWIVFHAHGVFGEMNERTQHIVDVQATRLENILSVRIHVTEATVQNRNLLIDDQPAELAHDKQRYDDSVKGAYGAVDKLIALSDSPERRATNQKLRETVEAYFAVVDRANAAALGRDVETARRIALTEGRDARNKVREFVTPRIANLTAELAKAKAEAEASAGRATTLLVSAAVAGLLAALAVAFAIVHFGLTRPLTSLVSVLRRMAEGDIDADIREAARRDTTEVTNNIAGVAQASEDTGAAASQVLSSSGELSRHAEQLTAEMSRFLATVRAA